MEKLIGGAEGPGVLTTAVRNSPFSMVLIDEIEKANSGLLNIFLNIFDEGEMSDGMGRTIGFKHTIIIATSNAGAEFIKEAIEKRVPLDGDFKESFIDRILREGVFAPEFINRFDAVALYRPLNVAESKQVVKLMLKEIQKGLAAKGIVFRITDDLAGALAGVGFDPVFGGRAMRRAIQNKVENAIASGLLSGSVKPGDTISINFRTWQIETEAPEK
jgi:ATP-dependent Clp protease ATP-binding subunit ClpA